MKSGDKESGARRLRAYAAGLLLLLGVTGPADAQVSEAEADSVIWRPRLDYESYGLSLDPIGRDARSTGASPVYAFTRLEIEGGHDSNVRRAGSGETASAFTVARPGVSLRWDGERHESAVTAQAAIGRYAASSGDDYEDLDVEARSRFEVDEDANLLLSAAAARGHVERGSDLDLGPAFGTQTYKSYTASAHAETTAFAGYPTSLMLRSNWLRFDDVDGVDRSDLDRWIGTGAARVGFYRAGDVSFFVQPGIQRVVYDDQSSDNPDSTRYDLAVGAIYSGGAVSHVSGFLGGSQRTFDASGEGDEISALAGLQALWNATDLVTLTADMSLSNEVSDRSAASSVTTTKLGFGVDYAPLENVIFSADVRWTDDRYDGVVEDERLLKTGIGVRYLLNEYAYVGAGLRYEAQSSNDPAEEYRATVGSLRLGLKLCCLRDMVSDEPGGERLREGVAYGVFR